MHIVLFGSWPCVRAKEGGGGGQGRAVQDMCAVAGSRLRVRQGPGRRGEQSRFFSLPFPLYTVLSFFAGPKRTQHCNDVAVAADVTELR